MSKRERKSMRVYCVRRREIYKEIGRFNTSAHGQDKLAITGDALQVGPPLPLPYLPRCRLLHHRLSRVPTQTQNLPNLAAPRLTNTAITKQNELLNESSIKMPQQTQNNMTVSCSPEGRDVHPDASRTQ